MITVLITFGIFVIIILALTIMIVVAEGYLVNHGIIHTNDLPRLCGPS